MHALSCGGPVILIAITFHMIMIPVMFYVSRVFQYQNTDNE